MINWDKNLIIIGIVLMVLSNFFNMSEGYIIGLLCVMYGDISIRLTKIYKEVKHGKNRK